MEVVAAQPHRLDAFAGTLGRIESHLDPAYDVLKVGRIALGDAPISLGTMAVSGGLKAVLGTSASRHSQVLGHASLATDGLLRGLLYSGGLLHGAAAAKMPWLVSTRAAPAGLAKVAASFSKVAHVARLGLLGIGGALGAIRAAKAVIAAQGNPRALLETRDGRGGVLQAVGSALLMVKHPVTYLAGAGVFLAAMLSDFA